MVPSTHARITINHSVESQNVLEDASMPMAVTVVSLDPASTELREMYVRIKICRSNCRLYQMVYISLVFVANSTENGVT
jgi:hypothetical protein